MWKCPALDDNGERTNMLLIVTESQITVAWTVGFSEWHGTRFGPNNGSKPHKITTGTLKTLLLNNAILNWRTFTIQSCSGWDGLMAVWPLLCLGVL